MEDQRNIHYRVGGKLTHCGVECLPNGNDIPFIVIERIEYKEREMINGRQEEGVWVAHFAPNPYTKLPFILNSTNRKRLVKRYPECEGYLARLSNVAVRLTKEKCRDVQDGGETWGLRISKLAPDMEQMKKKVITEDKIGVIVDWARKGGLSIDDVSKKYDYESDTVRNLIESALSQGSTQAEDTANEDLPE